MRNSNAMFWKDGIDAFIAVVLFAVSWVAIIWGVVYFVKKFW
jgi:hypothetical protein